MKYLFLVLLFINSFYALADSGIKKSAKKTAEKVEEKISSKGKELVDKIGDERIKKLDEGIHKVSRILHKNHLALKAGANFSANRLETKANTDDHYTGYGFNTHFGYHWSQLEISGSSYIHYGKAEELQYIVNDNVISGEGTVQFVSISPMIRFHTNWEPKQNYRFYIGGGPIWSIETVKLQDYNNSVGAFQEETKITYESSGGILVFGVEEQTPFKEMHPVFIEVAFVYQSSFRVSTVDISKVAETNILTTQRSFDDLETYNIMFSLGITVF
ncbi:MAG: hypothetical protein KC493_12260 [Bacteriovoracaceae bacterium]|nr:hypothetical protein [Bacteriovoracaceae bacterium]